MTKYTQPKERNRSGFVSFAVCLPTSFQVRTRTRFPNTSVPLRYASAVVVLCFSNFVQRCRYNVRRQLMRKESSAPTRRKRSDVPWATALSSTASACASQIQQRCTELVERSYLRSRMSARVETGIRGVSLTCWTTRVSVPPTAQNAAKAAANHYSQ